MLFVNVPRMWINLLELDLVRGHRLSRSIENQESGARGALVDRSHECLVGFAVAHFSSDCSEHPIKPSLEKMLGDSRCKRRATKQRRRLR